MSGGLGKTVPAFALALAWLSGGFAVCAIGAVIAGWPGAAAWTAGCAVGYAAAAAWLVRR